MAPRKGGIVWHTQGSGKGISMVCFAGKLMQQPQMKNPTIVVVTDRNDLDGQLFQTFMGARSLLKETPQQGEDRDQLRNLLEGRPSGGIIFTTVQKFSPDKNEDQFPKLSDRTNIVVIADEAHRSQYGFQAVLDKKSGKYKYGFAKHMRDALPNATFVGFTGTPVETDDKDTRDLFLFGTMNTIDRSIETFDFALRRRFRWIRALRGFGDHEIEQFNRRVRCRFGRSRLPEIVVCIVCTDTYPKRNLDLFNSPLAVIPSRYP